MAHQFLLHLDRSSSLVQKTPEGVAEGVPTDVTYVAALASAASGRGAIAARSAGTVFIHHGCDRQCDLGHESQVVRLFVPYLPD